jgi:hypothetical protein
MQLRNCTCGQMCRVDGHMAVSGYYRNGSAKMGYAVRGQRCQVCGARYRLSGARAYHVASAPEPVRQWPQMVIERLAPGVYACWDAGIYKGVFQSHVEAYDADLDVLVDPLLTLWRGERTIRLLEAA